MTHATDFKIDITRSKIKRTHDRAARAYVAGHPYTAYAILRDAGLEILWPTFLHTAKTWAGERYRRELARHSR